MCFPEAAWKEWKAACYEELESLDKHNVFELTDPPKGHKMIGCGWVFDIKGDGCKKVRLVTHGFSQVITTNSSHQLCNLRVCILCLHLLHSITGI